MRTPNPATLVLLQAGISVTRLAARLHVTPQAVSFQLSGRAAQTSAELLDVVAELTTPATARELDEAIAVARAGRRADA